MIYFILTPERSTYGPFTRDQLDECYKEGRLSSACQIRLGDGPYQAAGHYFPALVDRGEFDREMCRRMFNTTHSTVAYREDYRSRQQPATIINNFAGRDINMHGITE